MAAEEPGAVALVGLVRDAEGDGAGFGQAGVLLVGETRYVGPQPEAAGAVTA
jgi:hypothetical protein